MPRRIDILRGMRHSVFQLGARVLLAVLLASGVKAGISAVGGIGMIQQFQVREPLGRSWRPQWTIHSIDLERGVWDGKPLRIEDRNGTGMEGVVQPAEFHEDGSAKKAQAYIYRAWEPEEALTISLVQRSDSEETRLSPVRIRREQEGIATLISDRLEVRVPEGLFKADEGSELPAPILCVRQAGGEWIGTGKLADTKGFRICRAVHELEEGYRIRSVFTYQDEHLREYLFRMELVAHEEALRIEESHLDIGEGSFDFELTPGFVPTHAHMPAHRVSEPHKSEPGRISYTVRYDEKNTCWLQPFYCWNLDIGTMWGSYCEDGSYVGILPTHASRWVRPIYNRIQVIASPGPSLKIRLPLDRGTRSWMLVVCKAAEARISEDENSTLLRELLVGLSDLPLQKVLGMDLAWEGEEELAHPNLMCSPEDVPEIREKARTIPEFARVFLPEASPGDHAGVYLATDDLEEAEQAKSQVLKFLQASLDHFFAGGYSGNSVVAIGFHRPLRQRAIEYDLVAASPAFSEEERAFCRRTFAFICHVMVDRDYWPTLEHGFSRGNINFNSDMYTALGAAAGLLDGHPRQPQWMEYVVREMEDEFTRQVYPGGAWSECPTYHMHTMHYLMIASRILQKKGYRDFSRNLNFRATMDYAFKMQTPLDIRWDYHMMPTVGDTAGSKEPQGLQSIFAWMANLTREDPDFAGRMMFAWERGGHVVAGSGNPWAYALLLIDPGIKAKKPSPTLGSERLPGYGAILRNRWDSPEETYLLFKMGYVNQHFDADEGSFHWYARGVPLSMDFGCMYQPSINQPWFHSSVSFGGKRTWNQGDLPLFVSLTGADLVHGILASTDVQVVDEMPGIPFEKSIEKAIERQATLFHWERRLMLIKGPDYVVLRDDFDDPIGENHTRWSLPVLADSVEIEAGEARFKGQLGMDLKVAMAVPHAASFASREWGFDLPHYAERQAIISAEAPSEQSYLACLFPHRSEEPQPMIRAHGESAFRVQCAGRDDIVVLQRDHRTVELDGVRTFAGAALVSRQGTKTEINLLEGDFVQIPELDIFFTGPYRMEVLRGFIKGECGGHARSCFGHWTSPPLEPAELILDGKPCPIYHTFDGYFEFHVSEGFHTFEIRYPRELEE